MSKFQIILLVVFGSFIVIAVLVFSMSKGGGSGAPTVVVWGDIPLYSFNTLVTDTKLASTKSFTLQYVEKSADTIETDLTEALALGAAPDLVLLPLSKIWKNKNKLLPIPNASVSQKDFTSTFVEESELLLGATGAYALPLSIDPLVLYWNRDLFTKAAFPNPPKFWDEIYTYAEKLTEKDAAGNISKSALALGEAKNIPNFKSVLSLLMLQAGTPITGFSGPELRPLLSETFNLPLVPGEAALDFYTQFSNPAKSFYSWNRSLLSAPTVFSSGNAAMYIGYASEYDLLKAKNPTLNFAVAPVPQSRVSGKTITFGRLSGVAIVRSTRDPQASFAAALALISKDSSLTLSNILHLPPARRDLLSTKPADPVMSVFYDASIQSRGWLDPDDAKTARIFMDMIEGVTSGRARVSEAVSTANAAIGPLITPR